MKRRLRSIFAALFLTALTALGFAQNYTLTPQQEAMLNQLPPAQRQQALNALQQAGVNNAQPKSTLVEPISRPSGGNETQPMLLPDAVPTAGPGSRLIISFTVKENLERTQQLSHPLPGAGPRRQTRRLASRRTAA